MNHWLPKHVVPGVLVACLGLSATAQDSSGRLIENPKWSRSPSGTDMANYYPNRAAERNVSGWGLLSCRVDAGGLLTGCKAAAEAPEGWDFGHAALAVSRKFRMAPSGETGSLEGAKVRVVIAWTLGGKPTPAKTYVPGEPSVLITVADDGKDGDVFACPSEARPERQCQRHSLTWGSRPKIEDIAELIRRAGGGKSAMECSVGEGGALHQCRTSNDSALTEADLVTLASRFTAPAAADDETLTANRRVILTFDWKVLGKALEVFEAT